MQKVILYSLKTAVHLQTGDIRESTTLSRCDFSLFENVNNKVIFNIKNNDNINITSFGYLTIRIMQNEMVLYTEQLTKESHYYVLNSTASLPCGKYEYVIVTDDNYPLYADQNFNVRGYCQVKKAIPTSESVTTELKLYHELHGVLSKFVSIDYKLEYSLDMKKDIQLEQQPFEYTIKVLGTTEYNPVTDSMYAIICEKDVDKNKIFNCSLVDKVKSIKIIVEPKNQLLPSLSLDSISAIIYE